MKAKRPRYPRRNDASGAGELVRGLLDRHGLAGDVGEERIAVDWARLVGPRIAARSWPAGVRDGALVVRVANSAWLHELSFLEADLLARLRADLGDAFTAQRIRFVVGGPHGEAGAERSGGDRRRPRRPVRTVTPPTPADLERIDAETAAVDDDELREAIREARRRLNR